MIRYLLFLLLPLTLFGQSQKISDMTSATSLTGSEYVPIVQTTNKKSTVTLLRGWASTIGTAGQLLKVNSGATALEFFSPSYISTYPGAGIPLSTGSAWGTSITNNSANWNTAFGWGNHASAGYITLTGTQALTGDKTIRGAGSYSLSLGESGHELTTLNSLSSTVSLVSSQSGIGTSGALTLGATSSIRNANWAAEVGLSSVALSTNSYGQVYLDATKTVINGPSGQASTDPEIGIAADGIYLRQGTNVGEGITISLGSDAAGDIHYVNASGYQARRAIGSSGDVLTVSGGLPVWAAPTVYGDMFLANTQTVTAAKTFNNATLLMNNTANTIASRFQNSNTGSRVYTLPDANGSILIGDGTNALTGNTFMNLSGAAVFNITGTNGGIGINADGESGIDTTDPINGNTTSLTTFDGGLFTTSYNTSFEPSIFSFDEGTAIYDDGKTTKTGIAYAADYGSDYTNRFIPDWGNVLNKSATFTNKTFALGSNTFSGTTAQFNTALSDNDFATLTGTEVLQNKTLGSGTFWIANPSITDGLTITLNPSATQAGLNVGTNAGIPSVMNPGDIMYNSSTSAFVFNDGSNRNLSGTNTGDQALANTSDATSHTVTLTGGTSVQLIEGSNITLTTGGTGGAGTVTIASTGGSGITNGAANNEIMKSDGTNAVASGAFSTTAGDITLGTSLTGAARTITADGSATDVDINLVPKGAGGQTTVAANASGAVLILGRAATDTHTSANIAVEGTQTNINLGLLAKNAGSINLSASGGDVRAISTNAFIASNTTGIRMGESSTSGTTRTISTESSSSDVDIVLTPKGTGNVKLGTLNFNGDQTVGAGQDNYVLTYDNGTGLINLEAAPGGSGLTYAQSKALMHKIK